MMHTLIVDQETFGITGKSLKMLRDSIMKNFDDEILVIEVPTEQILCGFLVLNKTTGTAYWSGDGFRVDKCGEGGRGYQTAKKMLDLFGIRWLNTFDVEACIRFGQALEIREEINMCKALLSAINEIEREFTDDDYKIVSKSNPLY